MASTRNIAIALIAFVMLASCSPRIVPIQGGSTKVEYRDRIIRDSLFFRDSIYIHEKLKGDTVYIREYRDRIVWRDKHIHDTTFIAKHDTTIVEKPVPAKLSTSQKMMLKTFNWLLLAALALVGWTFRKPLFTIIKNFIKL